MISLPKQPAIQHHESHSSGLRSLCAINVLCLLLLTLRNPQGRIADSISSEASPARVFHARLELSLVRHISKPFRFGRGEMELQWSVLSMHHHVLLCSTHINFYPNSMQGEGEPKCSSEPQTKGGRGIDSLSMHGCRNENSLARILLREV